MHPSHATLHSPVNNDCLSIMSTSCTPSGYTTFPTLAEGSQTPMAWSTTSSLFGAPSVRARRRDCVDYAGFMLFLAIAVCGVTLAFTGGASIPPPPIHRRRAKGHVLLTGFQRQRNESMSLSLEVATALNNSCEGIVCFDSLNVRPTPNGIAHTVSRISEKDYVAVLMLGFKHVSKGFKLEVVARNIKKRTQKSSGSDFHRIPIISKGPRLLATTAPLEKISLDLLKPNFDVDGLWSSDLGFAVDNELYYRALHMARNVNANNNQSSRLRPMLFVHMPLVNKTSVGEVVPVIKNLAALMVQ